MQFCGARHWLQTIWHCHFQWLLYFTKVDFVVYTWCIIVCCIVTPIAINNLLHLMITRRKERRTSREKLIEIFFQHLDSTWMWKSRENVLFSFRYCAFAIMAIGKVPRISFTLPNGLCLFEHWWKYWNLLRQIFLFK